MERQLCCAGACRCAPDTATALRCWRLSALSYNQTNLHPSAHNSVLGLRPSPRQTRLLMSAQGNCRRGCRQAVGNQKQLLHRTCHGQRLVLVGVVGVARHLWVTRPRQALLGPPHPHKRLPRPLLAQAQAKTHCSVLHSAKMPHLHHLHHLQHQLAPSRHQSRQPLQHPLRSRSLPQLHRLRQQQQQQQQRPLLSSHSPNRRHSVRGRVLPPCQPQPQRLLTIHLSSQSKSSHPLTCSNLSPESCRAGER